MTVKIVSEEQPDIQCHPSETTLEDAYIYMSNFF